jgi:hypothetical protein
MGHARAGTNMSCRDGSGSQSILKSRAILRRHALISKADGEGDAKALITVGDTSLPLLLVGEEESGLSHK